MLAAETQEQFAQAAGGLMEMVGMMGPGLPGLGEPGANPPAFPPPEFSIPVQPESSELEKARE
jgi:hypothetical protein